MSLSPPLSGTDPKPNTAAFQSGMWSRPDQQTGATIPKTGHVAGEMARFLLGGLQPSWKKCHQQTLAQPGVKASPAPSQGQN